MLEGGIHRSYDLSLDIFAYYAYYVHFSIFIFSCKRIYTAFSQFSTNLRQQATDTQFSLFSF